MENAGKILSSVTQKTLSKCESVLMPILLMDDLSNMECPCLKIVPPSLSL